MSPEKGTTITLVECRPQQTVNGPGLSIVGSGSPSGAGAKSRNARQKARSEGKIVVPNVRHQDFEKRSL